MKAQITVNDAAKINNDMVARALLDAEHPQAYGIYTMIDDVRIAQRNAKLNGKPPVLVTWAEVDDAETVVNIIAAAYKRKVEDLKNAAEKAGEEALEEAAEISDVLWEDMHESLENLVLIFEDGTEMTMDEYYDKES